MTQEAQQVEYQYFYTCEIGIDKHGKDFVRREPRVTVCYIRDRAHTHVGLAVCSFRDNPCRKIGRKIAYQRALWVREHQMRTSTKQGIIRGEAWVVLRNVDIGQRTYEFLKAYTVSDPTHCIPRKTA